MLNKEAKEAFDLDQEELAEQEERKSKATGGSWGLAPANHSASRCWWQSEESDDAADESDAAIS